MSATFSANGKTYEISRTNYLIAEFDKVKNENRELNSAEEQGLVILQDKYSRIERLAKRVLELENKYYETFNEKDGELYEKAKAVYEKEFAEVTKFEIEQNGITAKAQKNAIGNTRKIVIKALQVDKKGNTIRTEEEAKEIWNSYVEENGTEVENEWLGYFLNYLTGRDKVEDDPFVMQAKAKAEQRANMKKGISKAR